MIFSWFTRVVVKVGEDEKHIFDQNRIMLTEVTEIEKVSGLSYMEWKLELNRFAMSAVAPLIHVLRKRANMPSDFATMQLNVADLDVLGLKEDGTEMTPAEMLADIERRKTEAEAAANPTPAAGVAAESAVPPPSPAMNGTSRSSPNGTASSPGTGTSSRGKTSAGSKLTPTGS